MMVNSDRNNCFLGVNWFAIKFIYFRKGGYK